MARANAHLEKISNQLGTKMAGKAKKPGSWGGKRPGSGRKPRFMVSDYQVKKMLARMRKAKREIGVDEDEFLVSVISTGITPEGD